jgi:hypothetical protein
MKVITGLRADYVHGTEIEQILRSMIAINEAQL